jgi:hypothetical protein
MAVSRRRHRVAGGPDPRLAPVAEINAPNTEINAPIAKINARIAEINANVPKSRHIRRSKAVAPKPR